MQRSLTRLAIRAPAIRINPVMASRPLMLRQPTKMVAGLRYYSADAKESPKEETEPKEEKSGEEGAKSELELLQEKFNKKDKEYAELKNHYLRSVADFRNLQETTKREIQKSRDFALQRFARDLLESIDNFDHALRAVSEDAVANNQEIKNLYDGVKMTQSVFEKTLNKHGIQKIDPLGEKFDPNVHEATFEVPQPDKEPGTVFHVQQPGYSLNDRVLRAAKVGIVKGTD